MRASTSSALYMSLSFLIAAPCRVEVVVEARLRRALAQVGPLERPGDDVEAQPLMSCAYCEGTISAARRPRAAPASAGRRSARPAARSAAFSSRAQPAGRGGLAVGIDVVQVDRLPAERGSFLIQYSTSSLLNDCGHTSLRVDAGGLAARRPSSARTASWPPKIGAMRVGVAALQLRRVLHAVPLVQLDALAQRHQRAAAGVEIGAPGWRCRPDSPRPSWPPDCSRPSCPAGS